MRRFTIEQICFLALCAVVNIIGGNLALMLRLPVYLDAIGTFLAAALLGPVYGMIPGILSGIISGITTDVYALYFMPVQLVTGLMAGLVFRTSFVTKWKIIPGALFISVPGTFISAGTAAYLFGGVTSSGSSILVAFLNKLGLELVVSTFLVQVVTDYADRFLSLMVVLMVLAVLPNTMIMQMKEGKRHGQI